MIVHIYLGGKRYVVEAPKGSRVVRTGGEDCLVYRHRNRTEYLPTPFVVMFARRRAKGLRVVSEATAESPA
jgi:hypothetical protein